jgi:hypothetical protein
MRRLIPSRRLIALLAAYVVALQALLLPLTVAAHPIVGDSLCSSATADDGRGSAGHDSGCACAAGCGMQCHAPALADAPAVALTVRYARVSKIAPARLIGDVVWPSRRTPLMARAPPVV